MDEQKSKKEILLEEINELNHRIEDYRKIKKDYSKLRSRLIELIIELDGLDQDKEYRDS